MVMLNNLDRFSLVINVIDRVPELGERSASLRQEMVDARLEARQYTRVHGEDPPDIVRWTWMQRRPGIAPGNPGGAADGT
jgi:xylulose-5-phosphate/fructose-6-phosphate phosphoketolase